jgi:hypothetical protein
LIEWSVFDHRDAPSDRLSPYTYGQTHELKIEIMETDRFWI